MKLSSKARYGLKAVCLLENKGEQILSLASLAEESGVSEAYLEQLFSLLKKSNIVVSTRGACGGYTLAKAAHEITVGEVVRALEDELEFVDCLSGECENKCNCVTHGVWQLLYKTINEALDKISIEDLRKGELA